MSHQPNQSLNQQIKHSVFDDKILVEHHAKYDEFEAQIVRWVIDTKDKVIRDNLIALFWTPPGESEIMNRYIEALKEVCDSHQLLQAGLQCKQREKKTENSSK